MKAEWLGHLERDGDLLLYAESSGEVVGTVFGFVENNGNLTAGIVAVDERLRYRGVAREMMLLLEECAKSHGVHLIALGAVQTAEGFYAKCGYTGSLLIQSEQHSIDELLSLNTAYEVRYTNVYGGTINQVCLALPEADRELRRRYKTALPGCNTQMMFWKNI
jgi:GNAT superfamily N-acetyltransferase